MSFALSWHVLVICNAIVLAVSVDSTTFQCTPSQQCQVYYADDHLQSAHIESQLIHMWMGSHMGCDN